MRPPLFRASFDPSELIVDSFAGGGGASTGIEAALGRPVDLAINHDPEAIALHAANHPETKHFCENIWEIDPREACGSRPVGLAWFSPDCKHFSRAKGSALRDRGIRGLAWVVIRWAKAVRPRIILLENVEEFTTWGPLDDEGRIDAARMGETFREWLGELTALGYHVEFRSLVAADYGAPTTRRRLFLVARCDGQPIVWPEPTHGKERSRPWRPAAEVIDWSLPCPSIFERPKPLAETTQRRIAEGIRRFVIEAAEPFVIPLRHHGWFGGQPVSHPVRTITASNRGELGLVVPMLIQRSWGERRGQRPRCLDIHRPLGTIVAGGIKHALVAAFIAKHYGGPNGHQAFGHHPERTLGTITAKDHHALTAVELRWLDERSPSRSIPDRCRCDRGSSRRNDLESAQPEPDDSSNSTAARDQNADLLKWYGTSTGSSLSLPLPTVTANGRGGGHLGLVQIYGEQYVITDIGLRMLQPHELFAAQGFPDDYVIAPEYNGKPLTKTVQVKMAGNSVPPPPTEALVRVNTRQPGIEAAT